MTLTRDQKKAQVKDLVEMFKKSQSVMFSHYIGLTVGNVSSLRKKLKEQKAEMKVAKKTLMVIAAKEAGLPEIDVDGLTGPVAAILSFEDPLSGAQVAFKFGKDHSQVKLIGGIYDGKILTKEQAVEMAKMPGRTELLAIFMSMLRSPLVQFASVCSSPLGGFARSLNQMADKGGFAKQTSLSSVLSPVALAKGEASAKEDAPSDTSGSPEPSPTV